MVRHRAALACVAVAVAAGCGSSASTGSAPPVAGVSPAATPASGTTSTGPASGAPTSGTATPAPKSNYEIFATAAPPNAPTQVMSLYHVNVPVGAVIAPHQHPGQQLGHVTAGTLTYTVMTGTVTVFDPPVDGKPGASRQVSAPATIEVRAGQSLAEPAGEIHRAENKGSDEVKLDVAVIVPDGDPISVPAG